MLQALSLVALVAVFTLASVTPLNMGLLAFVAAFVIGAASGLALDDVVGFFPDDTLILLVGITLLFGIAKVNGTIDLIVELSLRLVRGKRWAVVWMVFLLAGVLMSFGMVLAVAMLAPIAMSVAGRYKINPLLMGMMLSHGALGAALSPITVYGAFTLRLARNLELDLSPWTLFLFPLMLNLAVAVGLFVVLGRDLFRKTADDQVVAGGAGPEGGRGPEPPVPGDGAPAAVKTLAEPRGLAGSGAVGLSAGLSAGRVLTIVGILGLVVGPAVFRVDVGVTALTISGVLLLLCPRHSDPAMREVAWSAVLLVTGMLTLMAVLQENGSLELVGHAAVGLGAPILAALLLLLSAGIVSAFGSSIGTIGIAVPLAVPLIATGHIPAAGLVIAIGFCSTIVDVSPFSTNGIIVLAEARVVERHRFQRTMLAYTGIVVVLAPLLSWLFLLVL
jgi:di/tricarboxylate transporter